MLLNAVTILGHGTINEIVPRFFLQINDLGKHAMGSQDFGVRFIPYMENVIPQIAKFYDIYHHFLELLADYNHGIQSRKYYNIDDKGQYTHNKIPEREILEKVKDFFIHGKIMLGDFVKCGVINDNQFTIQDFYFADEKNFQQKKEEYLKNSDRFYLPLINLMEKSQIDFLRSFNKHRGDIEHNHFKISDFRIEVTSNKILVSEPILDEMPISKTLSFYYNNILDLIEKLIVYFLGLNGEIKNRLLQLFVRKEYDFTKELYKYTFAFGGNVLLGTPADRCMYN